MRAAPPVAHLVARLATVAGIAALAVMSAAVWAASSSTGDPGLALRDVSGA